MFGHLYVAAEADPTSLVSLHPLGVRMAQEVGELRPHLINSVTEDFDSLVVRGGPLGEGKWTAAPGSPRVSEVGLASFHPEAVSMYGISRGRR